MKFTVFFCSALLFAMSTMLDSSQLGVKAVPIANTFSSDKTILDDSDVVGLAQWGISSTMGPIDLTADEHEDQLNLGQLYSDSTQDDLDLAQTYARRRPGEHDDTQSWLVVGGILLACCICYSGCKMIGQYGSGK